uniref:Putative secreted protein n=1 Tax=Xenopsylla cheopis TaxID=163159 RepID=A0A6M2E113_XENCH
MCWSIFISILFGFLTSRKSLSHSLIRQILFSSSFISITVIVSNSFLPLQIPCSQSISSCRVLLCSFPIQ